MMDYLIVGLGLAGVSFCETLERHGKTFTAFNDGSQISSEVAGGMYNPVILKRFTLAWRAREQLTLALPFYSGLEKKLGAKLNHPLAVFRRFASVEEQNRWFEAADKDGLRQFLSTEIHRNENPCLAAPYGYGEVGHTGRVDTKGLLSRYKAYLAEREMLFAETFDYGALRISGHHVEYKSIRAKHLVFAEGFGLKQNPYFNYLPLNGTKGEYLVIRAPGLNERRAIKASIFIIPTEGDEYLVGANYKWKDQTNRPTEASKTELLEKLDSFLECDYQVVGQLAGIRPTVTDRRPLVGRHPTHSNLYVLNGFGSRGVMIAPMAAQQLYGLVEKGESVFSEMDCSRFTKKHFLN